MEKRRGELFKDMCMLLFCLHNIKQFLKSMTTFEVVKSKHVLKKWITGLLKIHNVSVPFERKKKLSRDKVDVNLMKTFM